MAADYKSTVNLPRTDFPMKANLPQREPEILRAWQEARVFEKLVAQNVARGAPRFVFHDGPPYANGDIHMGHALNKVLKDIIAKYRNMKGETCDYLHGSDCHGLPIEIKVTRSSGRRSATWTSRRSSPPAAPTRRSGLLARTRSSSASASWAAGTATPP